jgi:hypothetical protein
VVSPTFAAGLAVEAVGELAIIAAMDKPMRWVRAVCALGLAGCGFPPLAMLGGADAADDQPHVALTRQLATTSPSGAPSQLDYPPFAPGAAPQIRIATLDGAFMSATYSRDPGHPAAPAVPAGPERHGAHGSRQHPHDRPAHAAR